MGNYPSSPRIYELIFAPTSALKKCELKRKPQIEPLSHLLRLAKRVLVTAKDEWGCTHEKPALMIMKNKIILLMILLVLPISVYGFTGETHRELSSMAIQFCVQENYTCSWLQNYEVTFRNASIFPDSVIKDNWFHICEIGNCPALEKADEWYRKAYLKSITNDELRNQTATELGISSHYFQDSFSPPHQVSGEPSYCHSKYEKNIEKKLLSDELNWNYTQECEWDTTHLLLNTSRGDMVKIAWEQANYLEKGVTLSVEDVQDKKMVVTQIAPQNNTTKFPFLLPTSLPNAQKSLLGLIDKIKEFLSNIWDKIF